MRSRQRANRGDVGGDYVLALMVVAVLVLCGVNYVLNVLGVLHLPTRAARPWWRWPW
jgi:hypothetical protein